MQAFVRGLKEPLGSRIRCMRPDSIEKALEFVQEELNVMYVQQRGDTAKPPAPVKPTLPTPNVGFMPPRPSQIPLAPNWPMPFGQRQAQPSPQPFRFNPIQSQPQNRMPTRTQQMFSARPPNYNPQSNVFRLPPRNNNPQFNATPKPMSGVQAYTPKLLPQSNQPFYKPREMHMNECATHTESYYDDYYMQPESYYEMTYDNYSEYDPTTDQYAEITYDYNYEPNEEKPNTNEHLDFRSDRKSRKSK